MLDILQSIGKAIAGKAGLTHSNPLKLILHLLLQKFAPQHLDLVMADVNAETPVELPEPSVPTVTLPEMTETLEPVETTPLEVPTVTILPEPVVEPVAEPVAEPALNTVTDSVVETAPEAVPTSVDEPVLVEPSENPYKAVANQTEFNVPTFG